MDSPGSYAAAPNRDSQSYNEAQYHPLTAPMLHNATRSRLASLNDTILLRIMSHADDVDLFCLRRTCRTMLRLFSDPTFVRLHDASADVDEGPKSRTFGQCRMDNGLYVWPRKRGVPWKRELLTGACKKALRERLLRDMYCETCRNVDPAVEKRLRTEMLYCSGCKETHPAGLFSYAERRKEQAAPRQCIGRQGRIRACEHRTVSWEDVEMFFATGQSRRLDCNHPSHTSPFQGSESPFCPCPRGGPSAQVQVNVVLRTTSCRAMGGSSQPCCAGRGRRPGLLIFWYPHIRFPNLGKRDALDYSELLARFEWARSERGGAAYIFGPARRNEFRHEMIPFDPNYCSCVRIPPPPPGLKNGLGKWIFSDKESFTRRCPTHGAGVNWEEQGKTLDQSRWLQKAHIWISYLLRCNYSPQECIAMRYVKWIPLGECNTSVGSRFPQLLSRLWSIMTFTLPRQEPIRFPGGKTQPWSAAWFMALDPESYELRDDVESRGVYWCDTPSCRNHYRHHRINVSRRRLDADADDCLTVGLESPKPVPLSWISGALFSNLDAVLSKLHDGLSYVSRNPRDIFPLMVVFIAVICLLGKI
ncbi:hypothetical protein V8F06_010593 [Rhypophila decipiens]